LFYCSSPPPSRNYLILLQARKAGAVPILTALLKRRGIAEDETAMDLISSIIAACSGPMASGVRIRTLYYQGLPITVKEGALGDGVGAKVWTVAHTLCQEMAENHQIVAGQSTLEIGAGCGPCGILAAKIGAKEIVISDYVDQLLLNLRDALHMNGLSGEQNAELGSKKLEDKVGVVWSGENVVEENELVLDENWDPEDDKDVSECSDLDAFLRGEGGEEERDGEEDNAAATGASLPWEAGLTSIRFLDWADSVDYLNRKENGESEVEEESTVAPVATTAKTSNHAALDGFSSRSVAPGIPNSKQFDVVLGTDILYEWEMAESVAAAVAHRLKPGGRALICNAVRDQKMFDTLIENMRKQGLRVGVNQIKPRQEDGGVAPHDQPYEGGFVLVAAEHENAPAKDWHRDDLFP
jgi:predicted nicotinamide N-methyase